MKIPYYTAKKTREMAKKLGVPNTGGIAVKLFGIILYELPFCEATKKLINY